MDLTQSRINSLKKSLNIFLDQLVNDQILKTMGLSAQTEFLQDQYILQNLTILLQSQQQTLITNLTQKLENSLKDSERLQKIILQKQYMLRAKDQQLKGLKKQNTYLKDKRQQDKQSCQWKMQAYQSRLAQQSNFAQSLKSTINHLNCKVLALQKQKRDLQLKSNYKDSIINNLNDFKEIQTASNAHTQLERDIHRKQIEALKKSNCNVLQAKQQLISQKKQSCLQLTLQLQETKQKLSQLQSKYQRIKQVNCGQLKRFQKKKRQLQQQALKQRSEQQRKGKQLKENKRLIQRLNYETQVLKLQIQKTVIQKDQLQNQLNKAKNQIKNKNKHIQKNQDTSKSFKSKLSGELQRALLQNSQLQMKIFNLQNEAKTLKRENQIQREKNSNHQIQISTLNRQIQQSSKANQLLIEQQQRMLLFQSSITKLTLEINNAQEKNNQYQLLLARSNQNQLSLQKKIKIASQSFQKKVSNFKTALQIVYRQIIKLKNQQKTIQRHFNNFSNHFQAILNQLYQQISQQILIHAIRNSKDNTKNSLRKVRSGHILVQDQLNPEQSTPTANVTNYSSYASRWRPNSTRVRKSRKYSSNSLIGQQLIDSAVKYRQQLQTLCLYKSQLLQNDELINRIQKNKQKLKQQEFTGIGNKLLICKNRSNKSQRHQFLQKVRRLQNQIGKLICKQ